MKVRHGTSDYVLRVTLIFIVVSLNLLHFYLSLYFKMIVQISQGRCSVLMMIMRLNKGMSLSFVR